jgi:sphingolipid delta-4 desaturase
VFPSAITFRNYHLVHHRHQGEVDYDADLATPFERRLAGRNPLGKSLWFLFFPLWQPLRIARLKVPPFDRWVLINLLVQVSFLGGLTYFSGSWIPLVYMTLSSTFAVGFHPVGARWIQEHYIIPGFGAQETYSYYGPLNILAFNVGFHNEHHDFMMVPWSKLPRVKQIAPEYYNSIHSHTSWTKLWLRFLFDSKMSLGSRIVRQRIHDHTSQCLPVPTGSNTVQDLTTETVCEMPLSRQGYSS